MGHDPHNTEPIDDVFTVRDRKNAGKFSKQNDSIIAMLGGLVRRVAFGTIRVDKRVDLALEDIRKPPSKPTIDTVGTTPEVRGYKFDDASELMQFNVPIPHDYHEGKIELHLIQALLNTETDGDNIDWQSDYVVVRDSREIAANGSGDSVTKTSSSVTGQSKVVEDGNGNGIQPGTIYETVLEFDPSDADNPFDTSGLYYLILNINRNNIGGAGNASETLLLSAYLKYT